MLRCGLGQVVHGTTGRDDSQTHDFYQYSRKQIRDRQLTPPCFSHCCCPPTTRAFCVRVVDHRPLATPAYQVSVLAYTGGDHEQVTCAPQCYCRSISFSCIRTQEHSACLSAVHKRSKGEHVRRNLADSEQACSSGKQ